MISKGDIMYFAKDAIGIPICARCGKYGKLTKDHFIPKRCCMNVNEEGNYVAICESCNREKGCCIVLPSWYRFLNEEQKHKLTCYMRYARSFIMLNTEDAEILEFVNYL